MPKWTREDEEEGRRHKEEVNQKMAHNIKHAKKRRKQVRKRRPKRVCRGH